MVVKNMLFACAVILGAFFGFCLLITAVVFGIEMLVINAQIKSDEEKVR